MAGWTSEVGFYYDRVYLEPDDEEETEQDDFDEAILEEDSYYEY